MHSSSYIECGIVVIGRNEGERLERCLASVKNVAAKVVYVDSGSTDASVQIAESMGAEVVRLDMAIPFSAARARNEGFRRLRISHLEIGYVQFVDGDCELMNGWLENAISFLNSNLGVAIVCGRLRERFPNHSIYNLLCDIEWNTPVGETKSCGGIAMARVDAFESMDGFRHMIAGEEPELCVRLRQAGWKIWRLDAEMAWHDAAMTRFGQWWKRSMRAGYAFAEGAWLHGAPPEAHWVAESRRALIWGCFLPLVILSLALLFGAPLLALALIYPLQVFRLARRTHSLKQAFFLVLGKFPEALGGLKFHVSRLSGSSSRIIEYK